VTDLFESIMFSVAVPDHSQHARLTPPAEYTGVPLRIRERLQGLIIAARRNVFESSEGAQTRSDGATAGSGPVKGFVRTRNTGREGKWRECIILFH